MRLFLRGPAVEEDANRQDRGARNHERDAEFGLADAVVAFLEDLIDVVVYGGADLSAEKEPEAEGNVVETADADGFVVDVLPEAREGGED